MSIYEKHKSMLPPLNPIGSWAGAATWSFLLFTLVVIFLLVIELTFRYSGIQEAVDNVSRFSPQWMDDVISPFYIGDAASDELNRARKKRFLDTPKYRDPYLSFDQWQAYEKHKVLGMKAAPARDLRNSLFITSIILFHVFIVLMALAKYSGIPPLNPIGSWAGAATWCFIALTIVVIGLLTVHFEFRRTGVQQAVMNIKSHYGNWSGNGKYISDLTSKTAFLDNELARDPYKHLDKWDTGSREHLVVGMGAERAKDTRNGLLIAAIILIHVFIALVALAKYNGTGRK